VARGLRLGEGPLGVGSEFRIDHEGGFSLRYTVVRVGIGPSRFS